jgi:YD repeat-containing protein
MKATQRLLLLLLICTFFTACQKEGSLDDITTTPPTSNNRLKTYTEKLEAPGMGSTQMFHVQYDNNGRISSLVAADSPGDKFVFGYPANNRRTLEIFTDNEMSIHSDIFLNGSGLMDSIFQYNDTKDSSSTKYIYDAAKRVVSTKDYAYAKRTGSVLENTTTYSYNSDGDLVRTIDTDGEETLYEYYAGEKYEMPNVWDLGAMPASKGRLVKKQTLKMGGSLIGTAEHTYTFDAQNRLVTDKAVTNQGYISTKTYTYQ